MNNETLQFLGKMNAHISHELKNILATISETAGLMEDLIEIGSARGDLDPERLTKLCGRITSLVARGNTTVRDMNGLAHSMDEPVRQSDANAEAELMANISQYAPYSRTVELKLDNPDGLPLNTNSLQVQHLLAELLAAAFATLESDESLTLRVTPDENGARILLQGSGNLPTSGDALATAEAVAQDLSGAAISASPEAIEVTLKSEE